MNNYTAQLDDFDLDKRMTALRRAAAATQLPPTNTLINMHCHSFFSYNSEGWSPAHIAFNCAQRGLYAAGLCDFDVLDGLEEFYQAAELLGLRAAVHLETRAYVKEQATVDISSPGEPGVAYIMGCGFTYLPAPQSSTGKTLALLRQGAQERNLGLIDRINHALPAIAIDYQDDVVPLTPNGVATERHIVQAYRMRAKALFSTSAARAAFWSPLLNCSATKFAEIEASTPKFEDLIRNALAKRGGIGYIQPTEQSFPLADDFINWVRNCDAIPTIAWLDGTSEGEADAETLVELMRSKGCAALNIIPERNWNIKDKSAAERKQKKLQEIIKACVKRDIPINIGTEMNKGGLPFADDITGAVLSQYAEIFTTGAEIMVGHTILTRYAAMPYAGQLAAEEFNSLKARNDFFAAVGALPPFTASVRDELLAATPESAYSILKERTGRFS